MARTSVKIRKFYHFTMNILLFQRFFIHFYNVDDLIRCVLPYHEHNYFTRAIQMLRLSDKHNAAWTWLESAQVNLFL
jgi:hypothetical protein